MSSLPSDTMEPLQAALSAWVHDTRALQRVLSEQLSSANRQMTRLLERLPEMSLPADAGARLEETISGWIRDVTGNQDRLAEEIAGAIRQVESLTEAITLEGAPAQAVAVGRPSPSDIEALAEGLDGFSALLNGWNEAERRQQTQIREWMDRLCRAEADQSEAMRSQMAALESAVAERDAALAQFNDALADRDKALDTGSAALETAQQQCAVLGEALRDCEGELEGARVYIGDLEAELEALRARPAVPPEQAEAMEALCVRAARWQQACAEAEAHAAGLEEAHAAAQEESAKQYRELEAALSEARNAMDQRGTALRELSRELQETRDMLSAGQAHGEGLEKAAARAEALDIELQETRKRLAEREAELARYKADSATHQDEMREALSQLTSALRERDEAREALGKASAPGERLKAGTAGFESEEAQSPEARDIRQRIVVSATAGEGAERRLGELLLQSGVISEGQLEAALAEQQKSPGQPIGAILTSLDYATEDAVAQALACQLNLPMVHPSPDTVETAASRLLHRDLCTWHVCIPLQATQDRIVLAMANPLDDGAVRKIEDMTRRAVSRTVAAPGEILRAIDDVYGH
jgi:chromosome segregation ATPase